LEQVELLAHQVILEAAGAALVLTAQQMEMRLFTPQEVKVLVALEVAQQLVAP
jgi:hypothetical protein